MKIDFISDGSRQKNPSTDPATEKDSRLENPLKSGKRWIFQIKESSISERKR